jgi:copper transport protein
VKARAALAACALTLLVVWAGPIPSASAHAQLTSVTPQRGAVLKLAPDTVTFRFSETVTGTASAVRVYGPRGARVDQGGAFHPAGKSNAYAVKLQRRLTDGTYTATYQAVSADGHVISAGSTFSIGAPSSGTEAVSDLLASQKAGPITRAALTIARGVQFAAIALAGGTLIFLLLLWPRARARASAGEENQQWSGAEERFTRRSRTLLLASSFGGALSAALAIGLNAASLAGESVFGALSGDALSTTLDSRFGAVWSAAVILWLLIALGAALTIRPASRSASRSSTLLLIPAALLILVPGLGGHAGAAAPEWVLLPANAIHVLAATVWAGGIAALLLAVRPASAQLAAVQRTRLLVEVVGYFSAAALIAVVALALSGVIQAIFLLGQLSDLFSSKYGLLVLAKAALLLALVAIGALHRRQTLPGLRAAAAAGDSPAGAGRQLRNLLAAEAALLLAVFAATALLSGSAPPLGEPAGPANLTGIIGPAQYQATVDPASVGANTIHLYLLNPRSGAQWDNADEVEISERQSEVGIGPLTQVATKAGPGHYIARAVQFGAAGEWTIQFTVRVGEFDQYTATATVAVP